MLKKKLFVMFPVLLICAVLISACGEKQPGGSGFASEEALRASLTGTWNQVTEDGSPSLPDLGIPSGYVFRSDGSGLDLFWNMEFHYTAEGDLLHISYVDSIGDDTDYRMEFSGNRLALTRPDDPEAVTMLYELQQEEPESETETETETKKAKKK